MTAVATWDKAGLLYHVDDGVAWLRLNRPHRGNAMDHQPGGEGPDGIGLRDALLAAIREASEDNAVKAAVITGTGSTFCAGADLRQPGGFYEIPGATTASSTGGTGCSKRSGAARRRSSQPSTARPWAVGASWPWPAT
jgi:1,4-dihydroxy-2-naphthoyl-CoA synthase